MEQYQKATTIDCCSFLVLLYRGESFGRSNKLAKPFFGQFTRLLGRKRPRQQIDCSPVACLVKSQPKRRSRTNPSAASTGFRDSARGSTSFVPLSCALLKASQKDDRGPTDALPPTESIWGFKRAESRGEKGRGSKSIVPQSRALLKASQKDDRGPIRPLPPPDSATRPEAARRLFLCRVPC